MFLTSLDILCFCEHKRCTINMKSARSETLQLLVFTVCWPALKHLLSYWTYRMAVLFMTRMKETEAKPGPGAYRQSLTALLIRIRQQKDRSYLFYTKHPLVASSVTSDASTHFMCFSFSCGERCLLFTNGEKEIILLNLLRDYSEVFGEKSYFLHDF